MKRLRRVAILACWAGLLSAATLGAVRLDEQYRSTRFRPSRGGLCPLAVAGSVVTPMCQPTGSGW